MRPITGLAQAGAQPPTRLAEPRSVAVSKWSLLQAVENIREPLGLKGTSISLLRAMISFISGDHVTAARDDGHICFASNATLAKRTHVSVQTVERHIAKLVSLGLLRRRSSANGKRWARRDTSGRIQLATGLSLMPLVERHADFVRMNEAHQEKCVQLSILRDRCAIALTELKALLPSRADLEALIAHARNLIRRRPCADALTQLLERIAVELQTQDIEETTNLRGSDHENEGHKEPDLTQSVKRERDTEIKVSSTEMERAYPRLCAELRTARTYQECEERMTDIAMGLDLRELWFEIKSFGPAKSFMTLGYLLERVDKIKKPRGYALHLMKGLSQGTIEWQTLLKSKRT